MRSKEVSLFALSFSFSLLIYLILISYLFIENIMNVRISLFLSWNVNRERTRLSLNVKSQNFPIILDSKVRRWT